MRACVYVFKCGLMNFLDHRNFIYPFSPPSPTHPHPPSPLPPSPLPPSPLPPSPLPPSPLPPSPLPLPPPSPLPPSPLPLPPPSPLPPSPLPPSPLPLPPPSPLPPSPLPPSPPSLSPSPPSPPPLPLPLPSLSPSLSRRLLQHRQQTIAMSKQDSIASQDHITLAQTGTREVSPPTTAVLATPTLPTPASQPNLQPATSGGRQSVYIPSHESGDPSNTGDQLRQRSSTLPRRQPPPPPKRDERYTLSTAQSPSSSRGGSPRNSVYVEKGSTSDHSLATPLTTTSSTKAQSGPSITTPASPSRGGQMVSPSSPQLATRSTSDQSKPPPTPEGGKGGKGGGGLSAGDEKLVAMLSSFCDDLTISMEEEIKSLDTPSGMAGSPIHAPGSPFRARTLSNPRSSSSRRASNPVAAIEPLLPPVPGVNEAAAIAMPTATPPVTTPTATSSTAVAVVAVPVATPSATPTTTSAAVASSKSPAPVLAPPPPATPTLRTQFTDKEAGELVEVVRVG